MNEFKPFNTPDPRDNRENRPVAEPLAVPRDIDDLPISNWDEYKNWCEKVKENWDVN
ncbi:MAG: hypothetical protein AB8G16_18795 [Gammaproteobacteria bacterium]